MGDYDGDGVSETRIGEYLSMFMSDLCDANVATTFGLGGNRYVYDGNPVASPALEAPVEWVYRFYSPGLQRILFVIVTPGQEVIVRPHLQKVRRELKIVDIDQWAMDSPTALSNWLNNGGNGWLQGALNPTVSAQLTYNPIREELEWTVSGLDLETGQQSNYTARAE